MQRSLFSLEGKVALVTGGSRGIGRATALGFAESGADVVVTSRKLPDLEKTANEIKNLGRRALAVPAHLGKMEDIKSLVETVQGVFPRIDILVNNAGISPLVCSVLDAEERLWDSTMNLNLKGLFFLSQAVGRIMKEQGGGNIINVASLEAIRPVVSGIGIYDISKAGVVMATKVMAQELAQYNIRVNAIAPGVVSTSLTESYTVPERKAQLIKAIPMGSTAEPEEMVGAMIYLASDASRYMTGQTLVVDGGALVSAVC
jgi:NAD(P)-dependent dehydrogenase (short-subunit alcohol dehydrogenase family)